MEKNEKIEKLKALYQQSSKHSGYQIFPSVLSDVLETENLAGSKHRWEKERFEYINRHLNIARKKVLDIGGNTGYFAFESISAGAAHVNYYEGNAAHAEFVEIASEICNIQDKIDVHNAYYDFKDGLRQQWDIILLLNVLHHFGDDYGNQSVSLEIAKQEIISQLNKIANRTNLCVFQMGFNWKGNISYPLFQNGTKGEMIDYIKNGTQGKWKIVNIGVAVAQEEHIVYMELDDKNITRNDSLGEFLNRPIFILESEVKYG